MLKIEHLTKVYGGKKAFRYRLRELVCQEFH